MAAKPRVIVYCLLSPKRADALGAVRAHYRGADPRVKVIVDRRVRQRRAADQDDDSGSPSPDRRGVRDRRRFAVPRTLSPLPPELAERAGSVRWIQRMLPVGEATEQLVDDDAVLAAIRSGDPEAPTELYWRWYERIRSRLAVMLGSVREAERNVASAFGRVLDGLEEDGAAGLPLEVLVYREVDECAREIAELRNAAFDAPANGLGLTDPRLEETVAVRDYKPAWEMRARSERGRLLRLFGEDVVAIEHIGATAIPEAAARPIIDLIAGVHDLDLDQRILDGLAGLGFEDCGDGGSDGRIYFRRRGAAAVDLHVVRHSGALWNDALALRDHLRRHPGEALRWSTIRREAARTAPGSALRYYDLRRLTLEELLSRARQESRRHDRAA